MNVSSAAVMIGALRVKHCPLESELEFEYTELYGSSY